MTALRAIAVVLTALAWLPFGVFAAGLALAKAAGCEVHEGFAQPCPFGGGDIGGTLYAMLVMGWVVIAAFPFMLLSLLGWATWGIRRWRRRRA